MKVLFGVFDWGLGHATRDSPIIEELLKRGHSVDIISTGRAMNLLKARFRKRCKYFDVSSIYVPYPKHRFFAFSFVINTPKMLSTIKAARKISEKIISKGNYDTVISDCRYDVYDRVDNSYMINHQLRFKAPPIAEHAIERWLKSIMSKYKYVIVPDFENNSLSGALSHNLRYLDKNKIKYIGILSHVKKKKVKEDIDYFITISGPEPQRTILEEHILPILPLLDGKIFVTLGKPEESCQVSSNRKITICGFLNSKEQEKMMNRAKFIVTRSGYTTVMEIAELNKKNVLFIPTPGQTEQEYLADLYEKKGYFHHVHQNKMNLVKDIEKAKKFTGYAPLWKTKDSIKRFIEVIEDD